MSPKIRFCANILGLQTDRPSYWPKLRRGGQEIKKSIGIAQKILLHVILVLQKFPGSI